MTKIFIELTHKYIHIQGIKGQGRDKASSRLHSVIPDRWNPPG